MEVVAATPNGGGVPPFHDHDVREWSKLDSITGVLERARLETDHWTANTNDSCHKYGKVVDSRARTNADGALQQQARRQLEVFQSQVPGGRLQVVKTHTVSSSRWSSSGRTDLSKDFGDLQLSLNPLDLSSQKSKANVGRGVGRRPPSRPRAREEPHPPKSAQETAATNLYRVSRLCHQIHDSTVRQSFGKYAPISRKSSLTASTDEEGVQIVEIENSNSNESTISVLTNGDLHGSLTRTKSNSSEDLHSNNQPAGNNRSIEDLEDLEQLQSWRRSSKLRRSLQYPSAKLNPPKPADFPVQLENSGSVRKIREELEKGRRLSTALRGNNVDLEALDQILQSISSSECSAQSDKASLDDDLDKDEIQSFSKKKRDSFVTVETLQQVRGRLRRTSSPTIENHQKPKEEETDDGIVTEESSPKSRVRSYVYGMEALINNTKKPVLGTGSLESRSKLTNGNTSVRNEDWYNRRKSYGFEQVHAQNESTPANSLKSRVESSTDSGICRSSEIVVVPPTKSEIFSDSGGSSNNCNKFGNVKKITSIFDHSTSSSSRSTYNTNGAFSNTSKDWKEGDNYKTKSDLKSTTITIPIVSSNKQANFVDFTWDDKPEKDIKRHSIAVDESKYVAVTNSEPKFRRTSLAINEGRFPNYDSFIDDNTAFSQNRKLKRVEFCKTEVHFAAESGKVNIVETDEKPPPTNNFRRRRRNSGPTIDFSGERSNGLPVLHFGDSSYEKTLLGVSDANDEFNINTTSFTDENTIIPPTDDDTYQSQPSSVGSTVTVNSSYNSHHHRVDFDSYLDNDSIKGILKNKPVKPTPYHLGENEIRHFFNNTSSNNNSDRESSDSGKWGVRLKPVPKSETPYWKSTVTLHNTVYNQENDSISESTSNQPEFQRLLKNLRPTSSTGVKPDLINTIQPSSGVKFVSPPDNVNRMPWAVADRVKLNEDNNQQSSENKYSTKISFRDGSTTVIENDHGFDVNGKATDASWGTKESPIKDSRLILNRGLVVRIGREDYTSTTKHTVCSKTTSQEDRNNTTTTTKITIDLSPSPTDPKCNSSDAPLPSLIVPRAKNQKRSHSFKSTSLILDTILKNGRTDCDTTVNDNTKTKIPQQLEALKKLYEDVQSDSDADKEVQVLMGEIDDEDSDTGGREDDVSSVVSGSWSKMRAFKQINEHVSKASRIREIPSVRLSAKIEKDPRGSPKRVGMCDSPAVPSSKIQKPRPKESPVTQRRANLLARRSDLKTAVTSEKLSSPSLVGRSSSKLDLTEDCVYEKTPRAEPLIDYDEEKLPEKCLKNEVVLRQPKKSEMTYFGVPPSPKSVRKTQSQTVIERSRRTEKLESKLSDDKPDLLQHTKSPKTTSARRTINKSTSKHQSPERIISSPKTGSPIYENIHRNKVDNTRKEREFDSSILEELTKAADQILQAVNGFSDEDPQNRLSGDEEKEPLSTISETRSWSQEKKKVKSTTTTTSQTRTKLKHTSSTSSVDSVTAKDLGIKRSTPTRRSIPSKISTSNERLKKASSKTTSSSECTTKASKATRRLQRASSREALLQSHGSSSEDLGAQMETPLRKPRQIKKTKAMQLTITNGIEMGHKRTVPPNPPHRRRRDDSKSRTEESTRSEALPEIRHKTAVSTIRSTAEKSGRDRSKTRTGTTASLDQESSKRKTVSHHPKRDSSTRGTISSVSKSEPKLRSGTSRDTTVNHRISTANIKKCQRSDGTIRH